MKLKMIIEIHEKKKESYQNIKDNSIIEVD